MPRRHSLAASLLALLPCAVLGYSARFVEKQHFDVRTTLTNCYGITQDGNFYDFMSFHGKRMTGFSNIINKTAVVEFCFSVIAMAGTSRYNPKTKRFSDGRSLRTAVGHNYGYFSTMVAATPATNPPTFVSKYEAGDSGAPCFGKAARVAELRLHCTQKYAPCALSRYSIANCSKADWDKHGACICRLEAPTPCALIADLNIMCAEPSAVDDNDRKLGFLSIFIFVFIFLLVCIVCARRTTGAQPLMPPIRDPDVLLSTFTDGLWDGCKKRMSKKEKAHDEHFSDQLENVSRLQSMDSEAVSELMYLHGEGLRNDGHDA